MYISLQAKATDSISAASVCQLVGLTRLIEGGRIAEASIICENKNDESKLFRLNMFGDTGNAKVG